MTHKMVSLLSEQEQKYGLLPYGKALMCCWVFLHMTAAKTAFWQSRQQRLFGQLSFRQLQTANVVRTLGSRNQNKPKQKSKRVEYNKACRTSCSKLPVCCRVVLDQEAVSPQKQMC